MRLLAKMSVKKCVEKVEKKRRSGCLSAITEQDLETAAATVLVFTEAVYFQPEIHLIPQRRICESRAGLKSRSKVLRHSVLLCGKNEYAY